MANNLATLNTKLATQLRDAAYGTWTTGEMDDLLTWSTAGLYPRLARPIDPKAAAGASEITMVTSTYFYALPTGILEAFRLDRVGADATEYGPVSGAAWEITGDIHGGTAKVHVSPQLIVNGDKLRVNGYGRYELVTNLPPDDYVPLILAIARAEAYRRVTADRERFKVWLARNQTQNVTINELLQFVNDADAEAIRLWRKVRTLRRPVRGRIW